MTYSKPFPLKDSHDNEIVPPTECKYSRQYVTVIDLIVTYGKPFPMKDSDDNEIVPPTERKYS